MSSRNRSATAKWNIFFHVTTMLIISISGLVTLPIYLAHIDIAQYGAWLATGNIIGWAMMVDPGLSAVTQQRVAAAYGANDLSLVGKRACVGISLNCAIALFMALIASVLVLYIPDLLALDHTSPVDLEQLQQAAWLSSVGLFFTVGAYAITASNSAILGSVFIGTTFNLGLILAVLLQIYLVIEGWGILGIGLAAMIRGIFFFFGNVVYLCYRFTREKIGFCFDFKEAKQAIGLTGFTFMSKATEAVAEN
ncbi:hypothetical protein OAK93_01475, partial [bacterium]|nr:hypothetical protein [bacterium]